MGIPEFCIGGSRVIMGNLAESLSNQVDGFGLENCSIAAYKWG